MILLEALWWIGWLWCLLWVALPLMAVQWVGPVAGLVIWGVVCPWSTLLGLAVVHRLLPADRCGTHRMFEDRDSIRWALRSWAPGLYLTLFQPVWFMSQGFQRTVLRAFGARIGAGAWLTSRTIIREPHHLTLGAGCLIGEFVHLACSYQPRPGLLVVGDIRIGEGALIGAHTHIAPGARIGAGCRLDHAVRVGAHSRIGVGCRIGAGTAIYNSVIIGDRVLIGKWCRIAPGSVIPTGSRLADGTVFTGSAAAESAGRLVCSPA